ncbi:MAG: copper chaperone PCu(A)C [Rhodomicrobium sp.]|nr:copper chaperone PCu(A)C [Rhodomicrobium sp.]
MRMAYGAAAAGLVFAALAAQAQEYRQGDLTISQAWARPTAGPNKIGAAYVTLKNSGHEADTLTSASSPAADKVEVHEHIHDANGVMRMRPVEGGLKIAAGATVEMKPGGYHIMLFGLKQDLKEGQQFPLKLTFHGRA